MYRWILEKYYSVRVKACYVVCVHPAYAPDGFVDEVQDLQEMVAVLMTQQRDRLHVSVTGAEPEPTQAFLVRHASALETSQVQLADIHETVKKRRLTEARKKLQRHFLTCPMPLVLQVRGSFLERQRRSLDLGLRPLYHMRAVYKILFAQSSQHGKKVWFDWQPPPCLSTGHVCLTCSLVTMLPCFLVVDHGGRNSSQSTCRNLLHVPRTRCLRSTDWHST